MLTIRFRQHAAALFLQPLSWFAAPFQVQHMKVRLCRCIVCSSSSRQQRILLSFSNQLQLSARLSVSLLHSCQAPAAATQSCVEATCTTMPCSVLEGFRNAASLDITQNCSRLAQPIHQHQVREQQHQLCVCVRCRSRTRHVADYLTVAEAVWRKVPLILSSLLPLPPSHAHHNDEGKGHQALSTRTLSTRTRSCLVV